jgi:hypothetical protein
METKETHETLTKSHMIEWIYWDKEIKINTFPVKWNKNVLINIHGTFWSLKWWNNKYLDFASKLQENSISNVVLYESSRKDLPIDDKVTDRYKQKQAKFIWKTFLNELEDARRVIIDSIKNSEEVYWVNSEELEIILNWNSLGWILAFYLASEFPQVKNISTIWTWLRLDIKDVPILDTFPDITELEEKLELFKWRFLMNYWSEDDVFTSDAFSDLYKKVWTKEKSFVKLLWVDHTFWKVGWELSKRPYKEIFTNIQILLEKWELVSWVDNLLNEVQSEVKEVKQIVNQALIDKYMIHDDEELNFVW